MTNDERIINEVSLQVAERALDELRLFIDLYDNEKTLLGSDDESIFNECHMIALRKHYQDHKGIIDEVYDELSEENKAFIEALPSYINDHD